MHQQHPQALTHRYIAIAMQSRCEAINPCADRDAAQSMMKQTVERLGKQIFASKKFIGTDARLIVLPEYFLTGFPMKESITEWKQKACIRKDDILFEQLGEICRQNEVFISGNYYENDPNFSNIFFQSSFILDDQGEMILNYRRLNSMYSPTPHDVLDKYIDLYGYDALFPVADSKLGRLACVASEEILYPEVSRCLMMQGAEVLLHSSSEIGSPIFTKKGICKQARAIENMAYVVSANSAGIANISIPMNSTDGGSNIVHYEGHILAEASPGESIVANSWIDIGAMRDYRTKVSMKNYIARQRFELYAPAYEKHSHYPANLVGEEPFEKRQFFSIQKETIERLKESGVI